jgi:hypothetical protein
MYQHPRQPGHRCPSFNLSQTILAERNVRSRKQLGQFLTPRCPLHGATVRPYPQYCRALDPAIGSGLLACALVERVIEAGYPTDLVIEEYEVDADLCTATRVFQAGV